MELGKKIKKERLMNDIVITFGYFLGARQVPPISEIASFFEYLAGFFNLSYTDMCFGYQNEKGKMLDKSYKYKVKNLQKFSDTSLHSPIRFLGMNRMIGEGYMAIDYDLSVSYFMPYKNNDSYEIEIGIKSELINSQEVDKIFLDINEKIKIIGFKTEYAILFPMEKNKIPLMFVGGFGNHALTKFETELANRLIHNKDKVGTNIWDVFWGNIFNEKHFGEKKTEILTQLSGLVGRQSIKELGDERIYIQLPFDIFNYDTHKEQYEELRGKVRTLFQKYDLLIQEIPPGMATASVAI
jgi:hypothetical protein